MKLRFSARSGWLALAGCTAALVLPAVSVAQQPSTRVPARQVSEVPATPPRAPVPAAVASGEAIPGAGQLLEEVGDDFEDPAWAYDLKLPKVYNHDDHALAENFPLGESLNGRWHEGKKRGQPDEVRRVETPEGGLPGSTGAIAFRTLQSGTQSPSRQQQQEDLIATVFEKVGKIPVQQVPSVVTRVWLPPIEQWERRSGCHFAFRIALETNPVQVASGRGRFRQASFSSEDHLYWPGFFLNREYRPDPSGRTAGTDRLYFWMKATQDSRQLNGPEVTTLGWWTLGMSVTPDGQVHYFAKPGVEDLTAEDHIASAFPFGKRAVLFRTFFFNVCNGDDGRTWSTEFVVDDPRVYVRR